MTNINANRQHPRAWYSRASVKIIFAASANDTTRHVASRGATVHGWRPSAQIVMKYHAEDTSTLNGPRWFNRFRVGCAEPAAVPTIWSSAVMS